MMSLLLHHYKIYCDIIWDSCQYQYRGKTSCMATVHTQLYPVINTYTKSQHSFCQTTNVLNISIFALYRRNISSKFSGNSEDNVSKLLEKSVIIECGSQTNYCIESIIKALAPKGLSLNVFFTYFSC